MNAKKIFFMGLWLLVDFSLVKVPTNGCTPAR